MKAFREWMREQKEIDILVEAAGNLQGLPKKLIKAIINKTTPQVISKPGTVLNQLKSKFILNQSPSIFILLTS